MRNQALKIGRSFFIPEIASVAQKRKRPNGTLLSELRKHIKTIRIENFKRQKIPVMT
jgi:hypothetical protein